MKRIACLLSAAAAALALPTAAFANCTNRTPEDDLNYGVVQIDEAATHYSYVRANIIVKNPELSANCSSSPYFCFSYAWVMMTRPDHHHWAQWGPQKGANASTTMNYDQCAVENSSGVLTSFYDNYLGSSTLGSAPLYTVHYGTDPQGQSGNKIFLLDGVIDDWCGHDNPYTFTPTEGQAGAEIRDIGTELPGISSSREKFTNGQVIDATDGPVDFFASSTLGYQATGPFSWIGHNVADSQTFETWDGSCS